MWLRGRCSSSPRGAALWRFLHWRPGWEGGPFPETRWGSRGWGERRGGGLGPREAQGLCQCQAGGLRLQTSRASHPGRPRPPSGGRAPPRAGQCPHHHPRPAPQHRQPPLWQDLAAAGASRSTSTPRTPCPACDWDTASTGSLLSGKTGPARGAPSCWAAEGEAAVSSAAPGPDSGRSLITGGAGAGPGRSGRLGLGPSDRESLSLTRAGWPQTPTAPPFRLPPTPQPQPGGAELRVGQRPAGAAGTEPPPQPVHPTAHTRLRLRRTGWGTPGTWRPQAENGGPCPTTSRWGARPRADREASAPGRPGQAAQGSGPESPRRPLSKAHH